MTLYVIDSAIGEDKNGKITTKGWFRIYPGKCKLVISEELKSKEYFIYAKTLDEYNKTLNIFDSGQKLCISKDDFELDDAINCESPAHQLVNFIQILNLDNKTYLQTILADNENADKFEKKALSTQGIQKLLDVIGYNVGDIDGVYGGNTKTALSKVVDNIEEVTENGIFKDEVFEELLDIIALQLDKLGLKICNETRFLIWAAIGVKDSGSINSKGWYKISSSDCIKPYRRSLDGSEIYIYGEAIEKDGDIGIIEGIPLVWEGDKNLCIKDGSFNITKHEECNKDNMKTQGFQTIPLNGSINWTIRFAEP